MALKAKNIFSESKKRGSLEFYEYYSFIQNYLDKFAIRLKTLKPRKNKKLKRANQLRPEKQPEIVKLLKPGEFEVVEDFFKNDDSMCSID